LDCRKRYRRIKVAGLLIGAAAILFCALGQGFLKQLVYERLVRSHQREFLRRAERRAAAAARKLRETELRVRAEFHAHERVVNPETVGGKGDIEILTSDYSPGISEEPPEPTSRIVLHPETSGRPYLKDDSIRINDAIRRSQPPAQIMLRAGLYEIRNPIVLKSGVVLRGEGMRRTILLSTRPGHCIRMRGEDGQVETEVLAGAVRGSDLLEVAEAPGFKPGDLVRVYAAPAKNAASRAFRGQVVQLTEVRSTGVLRIDRPLRLTCQSSTRARVRLLRPIRFAGVESLTIETRPPEALSPSKPADCHGIEIDKALDCRVRDCELSHARTSHIWVTDSRFVTIERCWLHHGWRYVKPYAYGICLADYVSDCLVIDNTLEMLRHAMIVKAGANGNVYAYNYSTRNNPQRNKDDSCDFSAHGFYAHANLIEGNVLQFAQSSDYFGASGPLMTFFRNRVEGLGILITYASHFPVVVGNELQRGGVYIERDTVGIAAAGNLMRTAAIPEKIIYDTGHCPRRRESAYAAGFPKLIPSLFLSEKPDFLGATPWPCFGPDVATDDVLLPARKRYIETYSKLSPTAAPTGGQVRRGGLLDR